MEHVINRLSLIKPQYKKFSVYSQIDVLSEHFKMKQQKATISFDKNDDDRRVKKKKLRKKKREQHHES